MGTCSSKGRRVDAAVIRIPTPPPRQPFPSTSKNKDIINSRRGSVESEETTSTTPIPSKSRDVESETEATTTANHPSSILRPQTFSFEKKHETLGSSISSTTTQDQDAAVKEHSIRNKSISWADNIEGESDSISCMIVLTAAATTSDDDIHASLSRMKKQEVQGEEECYGWSDPEDDDKEEEDDDTTLPESKSDDESILCSDSSTTGYDYFRRSSSSSTSQVRFSLVYDD